MNYNILIAGVGGQGTLLAGKILGRFALNMNWDCKISEVHGMAQRGGSVLTHVRMGTDAVYSPIVEQGNADAVLAFEYLEALRYADYLKQSGALIYSSQQIMPMSVVSGEKEYPSSSAMPKNAVSIDALKIADGLGNLKIVNTVVLGKLCKVMKFDYNKMLDAIFVNVPLPMSEINKKGFDAGYNA